MPLPFLFPQMMPMSWLIVFLGSLIMFMSFCACWNFLFLSSMKSEKTQSTSNPNVSFW